ncbi:hypothetical protein G7046_g5413 [Stylonectria norvegica]|nr:hypothetical protein G7046_g5413 [Stylonectria norvegica]
MLLPKLLALSTLVTTALGSGASIVSAMADITNTTTDLQSSVSSWSGNPIGTVPIVVKSAELLLCIKSGSQVASASAPLTTDEAVQVAQATQKLAAAVNATLETIIAAKTKFDKLLLGPVILLNLELERDASKDFSNAVVEKVPEALQGVAKTLVQGIDDSFKKAIKWYNLF